MPLKHMSNLELFRLYDNAFVGSIPDSLGSCTKLREILPEFNPLSVEVTIRSLQSLKRLSVDRNNVTDKIDQISQRLRGSMYFKKVGDDGNLAYPEKLYTTPEQVTVPSAVLAQILAFVGFTEVTWWPESQYDDGDYGIGYFSLMIEIQHAFQRIM